jgi:chain length determinant protein EpsF
MNFSQFLVIVRARAGIVVLLFLTVLAVFAGISILLPRQYSASASVLVDVKTDPVASMPFQASQISGYMATQQDIITSERVARRVVETLGLDRVPLFRQEWQQSSEGHGDIISWLASNIQKRLTVTQTAESNVINLTVKWPDAKAAASLANAFARAYIDTAIELKTDSAKQYATWFDERSRALRGDLEAKQKSLSDYQNNNQIVATDDRLDIENTRLAELSSQLVSIEGQVHDSQSREQQAVGAADSTPEILQSQVIATLKGDLSLSEAKLKDIATQLGTNHPDYIRTDAEVRSLRDRLSTETAKVIGSLGEATRVNQRREHDISAALEAQKKRVLDLKHQRDEAAVLQNDVLTAQRNLDSVTQRLAQSSLESQTPQANIALLTPATEPIRYSSPNYFVNLVLGTFVGIIVGIGSALLLEAKNPRIRADEELVSLLKVPLLGRICATNVKSKRHRRSAPALAHVKSA